MYSIRDYMQAKRQVQNANIWRSDSKKALQFGVFLLFFTLINFTPTSALSLSNFFNNLADTLGIVSAQSNEENNKDNKTENVQNLKVFEAEKNLKAVSQETTGSNRLLDNDNLTLEAGKDNFYSGENLENTDEGLHGDNAIYKVRTGESIYSIASYFGISAETILSFNKISEKEVKANIILEIPPTSGLNYEVKKGDTLAKLAKKYNLDIDDLTLTTGYSADEELEAGEEVFLAGAKEEKKEATKPKTKNTNKSKTNTNTIASLGNLAKYARNLGRGSTAQFNKISDIKKYFSLPKYAGYYTYPAPGTSRTQTMHGHNGADFAGRIGTPVVAAAPGTVKVAKSSGYNYGFGNYITITHTNGTESIYAHLSAVHVVPGQQVSRGQTIGALGSSGNSTGPHLHFEIRGAYNPWAW